MRFGLDEDRIAFRDAARDLLARQCPPAAVRAAWSGPPDPRPWQGLAEMGVLSLMAPESAGGLGLDETFLVPVIEEAGWAGLPQPLTATALVAAPLGVVEPMVATDLGGPLAPGAAGAEAFLLAAGGGGLRLYRRDEVDVEPVETVDRARHCARVRPAGAGAGALVTDDPAAMARAFDRGALGTAAELVGLARRMLALAVAHVTERRQFGRPVGSFQAVKHHLAEARLQVHFAAPAVAYAAHALADGLEDASRSVSTAKWLAGRAAAVAGRAALQCHGAMGYTVEADLHLFLKRSWALARTWGDGDHHADRVATALGLGETAAG